MHVAFAIEPLSYKGKILTLLLLIILVLLNNIPPLMRKHTLQR